MDCCNTKQNTKKENREESVKGGKSMVEIRKNTMIWIVIGILFIATIFLTFKASSTSLTGRTEKINTGTFDTAGWTSNEKMNYEMHGTVPARLQGKLAASSVSSGTGMVGGC